ncbi:hypothetical protein RUW00_22690 [Bacillus sp. IS1]|uniref:hypothetical protein n=1 Tax=Bacillus TaxID=1386 RepID=UPI0028FA04A7|nr:hypothetical protein [Bacillus sp. IG2]MDU0078334.1 hypothetical protein [Bacillus sp. IG2]MDU0104041.1 hypothetical protein [Bacillus sp. IS1]
MGVTKGASKDKNRFTEWKSSFCLFIFLLDLKKLPLPSEALNWELNKLRTEIRLMLEKHNEIPNEN